MTAGVTAADNNVGVTKVELFVDGKLQATRTAPPFGFSVSLRRLATGAHRVHAKGNDAAGNVGTSAQSSFTK